MDFTSEGNALVAISLSLAILHPPKSRTAPPTNTALKPFEISSFNDFLSSLPLISCEHVGVLPFHISFHTETQ